MATLKDLPQRFYVTCAGHSRGLCIGREKKTDLKFYFHSDTCEDYLKEAPSRFPGQNVVLELAVERRPNGLFGSRLFIINDHLEVVGTFYKPDGSVDYFCREIANAYS